MKRLFKTLALIASLAFALGPTLASASNCHADAKPADAKAVEAADAGQAGHQIAETPKTSGCNCGADCKCGSDKTGCKCGPDCKCAKMKGGECKCGKDCKCEHCGGCKCQGEGKECKCGPDCQCGHCQGCKCGQKG